MHNPISVRIEPLDRPVWRPDDSLVSLSAVRPVVFGQKPGPRPLRFVYDPVGRAPRRGGSQSPSISAEKTASGGWISAMNPQMAWISAAKHRIKMCARTCSSPLKPHLLRMLQGKATFHHFQFCRFAMTLRLSLLTVIFFAKVWTWDITTGAFSHSRKLPGGFLKVSSMLLHVFLCFYWETGLPIHKLCWTVLIRSKFVPEVPVKRMPGVLFLPIFITLFAFPAQYSGRIVTLWSSFVQDIANRHQDKQLQFKQLAKCQLAGFGSQLGHDGWWMVERD